MPRGRGTQKPSRICLREDRGLGKSSNASGRAAEILTFTKRAKSLKHQAFSEDLSNFSHAFHDTTHIWLLVWLVGWLFLPSSPISLPPFHSPSCTLKNHPWSSFPSSYLCSPSRLFPGESICSHGYNHYYLPILS